MSEGLTVADVARALLLLFTTQKSDLLLSRSLGMIISIEGYDVII